MWETWDWPLGWEDPLEKGMATHSSILAWGTPWTEEPGELQSMGSQRVRHDWETNTLTFKHQLGFPGDSDGKESACNAGDLGSIPGAGRSPGERNGNPLQYSCLENSMDREAWWATVHGVAKSQTRLKQLSSNTSSLHLCLMNNYAYLILNVYTDGEGNGNPLQYSCLENSMDREAWWATVHVVAKSWTQLSATHSDKHSYTFFHSVSQRLVN